RRVRAWLLLAHLTGRSLLRPLLLRPLLAVGRWRWLLLSRGEADAAEQRKGERQCATHEMSSGAMGPAHQPPEGPFGFTVGTRARYSVTSAMTMPVAGSTSSRRLLITM